MDYHLIIVYKDYRRWKTSFSASIHPEVVEYAEKYALQNSLQPSMLTEIRIGYDGLVELENTIDRTLTGFLNPTYIDDKSPFRLKQIKSISYKGETYALNILNAEEREILNSFELLEILLEAKMNNGDIIVYPSAYVEDSLFMMLHTMNSEEIYNVADITKRIDAVRLPNFNVLEGLKKLEQLEFIRIDQQVITITPKGKIG